MSAPPTDPFEMLRRFWAPLGLPIGMPGTASPIPGMAFPTLDVGELEKRIGELRSVEGWLGLNLEMVRTTIHGLEAQKSTIEAFRAMQPPAPAPSAAPPASEPAGRKRRSRGGSSQ